MGAKDASRVASFFAEKGRLTINGGTASVGRSAITAAAQAFMAALPDMVVTVDSVTSEGGHVVFHWTLTGTNTGPRGKGKAVGALRRSRVPATVERRRLARVPRRC
jgi:SnoaL-like domain